MKKKITIIPAPSKELIDTLPDYITIGEVDNYKKLNVDSIRALRDKGLDGYLNKTTFKQTNNGFQSNLFEEGHQSLSESEEQYQTIGVNAESIAD